MLKHEYTKVNGIRLHYVTAGSGRLILFVHGFPEFWYAWRNQLAEFGRDHEAVAPDMRGYNLSSKPTDVDQYQIKILVEDLRQLGEHLGHKRGSNKICRHRAVSYRYQLVTPPLALSKLQALDVDCAGA